MVYYADDIEEREDEPRELPTALLDEPGRCCICHKPGRRYGCWRCGRPVCMDLTNYQADSTCGGWIMDWWSNGAMDPDDGNEFWCKDCLEKETGMAMENWMVCAEVTSAAREVIEANGGKIEVLREERPRLLLVTVAEALYHGFHEEDGYFSYELSRRDGGRGGNGQGVCWWNDDPIALTIYRWNGTTPDDPRLQDAESEPGG